MSKLVLPNFPAVSWRTSVRLENAIAVEQSTAAGPKWQPFSVHLEKGNSGSYCGYNKFHQRSNIPYPITGNLWLVLSLT